MVTSDVELDYTTAGNEKIEETFEALIGNHEDFYTEKETYIDCGAGSGIFSLLCTTQLKAKRVYAYEGFYENFSRLLENRKKNSAMNIVPDDHHILGNTGRSSLNVQSGIVNAVGAGEHTLIETRNLDDLYLPAVDLINIAVPGAALDIVKGGFRRLTQDMPSVIVETVNGKEQREVKRLLEGVGLSYKSMESLRRLEGVKSTVLFFSNR